MRRAFSPRPGRVRVMVGAGLWLVGTIALGAMARTEPGLLAAALLGSYLLGWGTVLVLTRPSRSQAAARFILMTLTFLILLGGLEALSLVGLYDFRTLFGTRQLDPRLNVDNVPDPELIHIHKPYLRRSGTTRGDIASALHLTDMPLHPFDVVYDRNGFRNARRLTVADVVVLGDSFVEGGLVAAEDLLTTTLGDRLGCTVANLGQSGYGPQQELIVLKRYAVPLHPRLCIWTFYEGNDLDDVERYEQLVRDGSRADSGATCWDRSFGRNALLALSRELGRVLDPVATDQMPCGLFDGRDGRKTRLFFRERNARHLPHRGTALGKISSVLTAADASCKASGMTLLVVFAPGKFRVYKDHCTFHRDNPGADWTLDDLPERLRALVAAIGPEIGFLDLTPALIAEAAKGRLVYFADDTHWSAEGHRAAGQAIADHVLRHGDLFAIGEGRSVPRGQDNVPPAGQSGEFSSPDVSGSRKIIFRYLP